LVEPTLTMSREGTFIGSITTSGSRTRASAAISSCPRSSVTAITARRPLTARVRAQLAASAFVEGCWSTDFTPMVTATPSSAAVAATPVNYLGGVAADLAAQGQLDGRGPLDGPQPAAVVVGAEQSHSTSGTGPPGATSRRPFSTFETVADRDARGLGHSGPAWSGLRRRHLEALQPLVA
jgi:hypothetical protein